MTTSTANYGVKLVRGPSVSISPHPDAVNSPTDLLDWVATREIKRPLAVDLFCGAGGLSIGLAQSGYDVVLGVDDDPVALETYAGLHPGLTLCRDLSRPSAVREVAELISELNVELIAGGPPCQPFSKAGASKIRSLVRAGARSEYDDRRDRWQTFLEIVLRVQPPAVLLENVPDMAISEDTRIVRTLVNELETAGYAVHTALIYAYEHGVPQLRQRFFLVALASEGGLEWPVSTTSKVTVRDAILDLPSVEGGWRPENGAKGYLPYDEAQASSMFVQRARRGLSGKHRYRIYDHITRPVREDDKAIFTSMDSSTRYSDIDDSLKRYRDDIFDDKYKRLAWDEPSRSITAHIARDGYWYIHPSQTRTLTVREAARLQTFPDYVRFAGPPSAAFRQIGNAVPPLLAERVGKSIRQSIRHPTPAGPSTCDLSDEITSWFKSKVQLKLPWLAATTAWASLQGQLLLDRIREPLAEYAWPIIEKLDSPESTNRSADLLREVGNQIGRRKGVELILEAARWYVRHPGALTSVKGLQSAPSVGATRGRTAALVDERTGPTPVVVSQGSLRVASRIFGLSAQIPQSGSAGRLAVIRLLKGATASQPDDSRVAMAGVLELAASVCRPKDPLCRRCPVVELCNWTTRVVPSPTVPGDKSNPHDDGPS